VGALEAGEGRRTPVQVTALPAAATALDAGSDNTCAVASGGAYCWGLNLYGQVGDGSYRNQFTPTPVMGLAAGVQTIHTAFDHTCALLDNAHGSRLMCWGSDAYGQLGRGRDLHWTLPQPLGDTPDPHLTPNVEEGRVGSIFTLVGANFPPTAHGQILINGQLVYDALVIDQSGQLRFYVDSQGARPGDYLITVKVGDREGNGQIHVRTDGIRQVQEGGGLTVTITPTMTPTSTPTATPIPTETPTSTPTTTPTPTITTTPTPPACELPYDFNEDGIIDILDIMTVIAHSVFQNAPYDPTYDLNQDGVIDIIDITLVAMRFGDMCPS